MFELKFTIKKTGVWKKPMILSPNNLGIKLLSIKTKMSSDV